MLAANRLLFFEDQPNLVQPAALEEELDFKFTVGESLKPTFQMSIMSGEPRN